VGESIALVGGQREAGGDGALPRRLVKHTG
jgi:hypothetical protein